MQLPVDDGFECASRVAKGPCSNGFGSAKLSESLKCSAVQRKALRGSIRVSDGFCLARAIHPHTKFFAFTAPAVTTADALSKTITLQPLRCRLKPAAKPAMDPPATITSSGSDIFM